MQETDPRPRVWALALATVMTIALGTEAARAQDARAIVSMVETALAEFETPNGPVIELEGRFECGDPQGAEPVACPTRDVEAVLAERASALGIALVGEESSIPPCRWSEGEVTRDRGVRMAVDMSRDEQGSVWMSVRVRCRQPRSSSFRRCRALRAGDWETGRPSLS